MKRVWSVVLLLALLLSACHSVEKSEVKGDFLFYFPSEDLYGGEGFIVSPQSFEGRTPGLGELIRMYFSAQPPEGAKSVIPEGWRFSSHGLQTDGLLILNFAGEQAAHVEESLALACATRTFSQVEEIRRVKLCPPGGGEPVILSVNDLLLEDKGMFPQEELVLYFPDEQLRYLRRESSMVESVAGDEKPSYIMKRLLEENQMRDPHSCIPEGTAFLDARVENGVCTVDLSWEFAENFPKNYHQGLLAVYSIVNSLTELEEVRTVDITVARTPLEQLQLLDLSRGLQRDESMIRSGKGYDGTIYPYDPASGLLVECPVWLPEDPEISREEQLLRALLDYNGEHLVEHSIPQGTNLLSVRMAQNTCVVDLTAEFIDREEDRERQKMAVRSIVATLCSLSNVQDVEILVEGNRPKYLNNGLQGVRASDPSWFAE